MEFSVASRRVGPEEPPLVIAEAGINHEGQLEKALALVDAAAQAGAEAIKFQCHITQAEMVPNDIVPPNAPEGIWDIIQRCELNEAEERRVQAHCEARGLIYLSTPFSREAADRLADMGVSAFKIGSGECNNLPLIEHIARLGLPIILSTGMNDLASLAPSVAVIERFEVPLVLMHCTSCYPTPYEDVRLGALSQLQSQYPQHGVGLSDHSLGIWTALGAVALGAWVVEKHFTCRKDWPGPDIPISIDPSELRDLVEGSRAIWQARGGEKSILPQEQPIMDFAYASVVSTVPISAGQVLSADNLWVKRPGTGDWPAKALPQLLGRRATRDIPAHVMLETADVD